MLQAVSLKHEVVTFLEGKKTVLKKKIHLVEYTSSQDITMTKRKEAANEVLPRV